MAEALREGLPAGSPLFTWQADATDNPCLGLLGLADRFVVTGDSVSKLVEVDRLGRPLAPIFQPEAGSGRAGPLSWLGNRLYDLGLVGYAREFEAVHARLIDGGFAVMLGHPFAPARGPAVDDAPAIAARLRALLAGAPAE